jgi:1-deoxy-D-xylulose-5-phosphate synthase
MLTPENIQGPADLDGLTPDELQEFASDVRRFLLENISQTGGHIGANLGTVELSVALHAAFDSPNDALLWDTGHQGYTHKIITGRAEMFPTLNTYGGMNRFVTRDESEHDPIEASHAGTSISVALGMALANKLKHLEDYTVAIIGDGALAEGMALEALNHAAVEDTRLIVVINDNGFAISPGFGGIHEALQAGSERAGNFFDAFGFDYIGEVDGHDVQSLLNAFEDAQHCERVPVIHVKTIKGYGWEPAAGHPFRQHFSFPFDEATGELSAKGSTALNYQDVAARVIGEEMRQDASIVAITPSTLYATGLTPVFEEFPERTFDPGMEEQHALTLTVGLALGGMKPVISYQSTFLQRAFDQLIHDVCFMQPPVLILGYRSGFAGYDNPTHHGVYDFAYLRGLPNLNVLYPKDAFEAERMVRDNLRYLSTPTLILMPYGPVQEIDPGVLTESPASFAKAEIARQGKDMAIITVGNKFETATQVADMLAEAGVQAELVNLRYIKPLPEESLQEIFSRHSRVITIEEGVLDGGVGSAISAFASDCGFPTEILRIGLPCDFIAPGSNEELSAKHGLRAEDIFDDIVARWHQIAMQAA